MHHRSRWQSAVITAAFLAAGLTLPGCGSAESEVAAAGQVPPAQVVPIAGTDLHQVILTQAAAQRIGVKTELVREVVLAGGGAKRTVIPMASVLYDKDGNTWAYTNPEALTFVRQRLVLGHVDGDLGELQSGPPPGTPVVTVGAAELFGAETGVPGEQ